MVTLFRNRLYIIRYIQRLQDWHKPYWCSRWALCWARTDSQTFKVAFLSLLVHHTNFLWHSCNIYLVGCFDANKCLSKRHRSEATIEKEEANIGVDMKKGSNIQIVGQCCWQSQDSDHTLGGLHLFSRKQHKVTMTPISIIATHLNRRKSVRNLFLTRSSWSDG